MARDTLTITPVRSVSGAMPVPGDKSISHRYVLLAGIASGRTTITGLAPGADVASTCACMGRLGVRIERSDAQGVVVDGRGWAGLQEADGPLDAGNSGTSMRLLAGVVAGRPFRTTLTGDASLSRRPMRRVLDPLAAMGARVLDTSGHAPITIEGGPLAGIHWQSAVASAQVKSAIMLAGLSASGSTAVTEPLRTRDHTERAFPAFGLAAETRDLTVFVMGGQEARAPERPLHVPGDPSSAAVWAAAAAALPGGAVEIEGVCLNPRRLGFVRVLERMGARITTEVRTMVAGEPVGTLHVAHAGHHPAVITPDEVPDLVDELPVLAARAALGAALEVSGAAELRVKESDRISALVAGFRRLGVSAEERTDGFVIDGSARPRGGTADAAADHRLVMAFALVGLGASGPSSIEDAGAVAVSYPGFTRDLARLST